MRAKSSNGAALRFPIENQKLKIKNLSARAARLAAIGCLAAFAPSVISAAELSEAQPALGPLQEIRIQIGDPAAGEPAAIHLRGKEAHQQILVTGRYAGGALRDFTRQVHCQFLPEGIALIDSGGRVTPLRDGRTRLEARAADGRTASAEVTVDASQWERPINFANQIVPVFTKAGCNGGGCHGKSSGQNGFRLSLLGFEPRDDYRFLVEEGRGRRIFPAAPEQSLFLLKPTETIPHGGGKRLEVGSDEYRLLVRWIRQGMPYGNADDPKVDRIEVFPKERTLGFGSQQQLAVTAHYTDGTEEDVTRSALYEPNEKEMARVDENGLVQLYRQPGDVAVMVRYQSQVAVFRATIPLGAPVKDLPAPRNYIDELVFKKLRQMGMPPSEKCDDATFLRRVSIDIAGRLPAAAAAKAFLADADPGKRDALIERLLRSPEYADYFANKWSALLRNKRRSARDAPSTLEFHDWIRESLIQNKPYDQFVREILAASGDALHDPPVVWYQEVRDPRAELEDVAQLFLGMRLQCAQCHHHPFERWSQQDYYSFSAFFTQVGRQRADPPAEEIVFHKRGVASAINKRTEQRVFPAVLGGPPLRLSPDDDPREALADWMASPRNPFFARALVNRYWKHFFGRGLVDPEDDMRATNPAANPELLDALARHFIGSGFDLKELIRTICRSETYQRSAFPNAANRSDTQNFSRNYPKRLTAEVLLDAVDQVTGSPSQFEGLPRGTRAVELPDNSFNETSYFLEVFGRPDSSTACECERSQGASLAQSLHLLNAQEIQAKLTDDHGRAAACARRDQSHDGDSLTQLYLAAYSRLPRAAEIEIAEAYLTKQTAGKKGADAILAARRRGYEDIMWALVNSKEFLFNH